MRRVGVSVVLIGIALTACGPRDSAPRASSDSAARASLGVVAKPSDTPRAAVLHAPFRTIGRRATAAEVRAWDIDVNGAGKGLPSGRGTYARGAKVYAQQCASCHGPNGEGLPGNPKLVGTEPSDFSFGRDPKLVKTIGNYWPYATTLYDYINRAMPFNTPGSLPPDDVYSVVAYLLAENKIIEKSRVIDARSLPRIRMPARDRFVPDDRIGGTTFR
jgi:S-disulfanyl-L-cysteine oxidoreductase SoxD